MSIDICYETVIAELTERGKIQEISKKLLSLKSNDERVLYVYELLYDLKALPKIRVVNKCETASTDYRNHGNQCFQNKDDYKAWQYYNLSLLHAPPDTDNYCLALANRSAVFHSLKRYKECLEDIHQVLSMKYPEKLKEKLFKRQSSCKENVDKINCSKAGSNEGCDSDIVKLCGPSDSRYPCASSKLEVVFSEEMGRHVVARENIRVGEILVQENPYFTLLLKSQFLFSCCYCLSRKLNLLPCSRCCCSLYCSTQCRDEAWKQYHSVECGLMATLIHMQFTKLELLALRTVIKARNEQPNWHGLFHTIHEAENKMSTEFRGHVNIDNQWVYDSKYYASIHTLASNIERRSISDIFQKSVSAAVFLHLLNSYTKFLTADTVEQHGEMLRCAAGLLLLHIMTSPTNMHGVSTNVQTAEGHYVEEINLASAPYAFHSLLNHSCAPNVVRFGKLGTGQMSLCALRPIKKGMQLYDNYGSHHALQDRKTRQEALKFQYKFTCLCEACVHDWPTYLRMKRCTKIPLHILTLKDKILDSDAIDFLQRGDKGTALKLFKPLCELVEALDPYAPCVELADCQESLKQCLAIIEGVLPYGFSNLIEWDVDGNTQCSKDCQ